MDYEQKIWIFIRKIYMMQIVINNETDISNVSICISSFLKTSHFEWFII